MSIYKSRAINDYMKGAAQELKKDPEVLTTFERLAVNPDQVPVEDIKQALRKVIENDKFVTGPIKVMLEDEGVRKALSLPADVTFDSYILRVRKAIRDSKTLEDLTRDAQLSPSETALTAVATVVTVGVAVAATVAAVVHTVATAVNYVGAVNVLKTVFVFTVAGQDEDLTGRTHPRVPVSDADPECNCINDTDNTLWVVVRNDLGIKRVPLPPHKSTVGMGLPSIEAILVGGNLNALESLHTERDGLRKEGAYIPYKDVRSPGVVSIRQGIDCFEAHVNDAQREAEAAGQAGYSDLNGGGSAGEHFDQRFRMREVAAAVPEGCDFIAMMTDALDAEHFYRTLRLASMARAMKEGLTRA
jgi:hypothetical protein